MNTTEIISIIAALCAIAGFVIKFFPRLVKFVKAKYAQSDYSIEDIVFTILSILLGIADCICGFNALPTTMGVILIVFGGVLIVFGIAFFIRPKRKVNRLDQRSVERIGTPLFGLWGVGISFITGLASVIALGIHFIGGI